MVALAAGPEGTFVVPVTPLPGTGSDGSSSGYEQSEPGQWVEKRRRRRGQDKGNAPLGKAPQGKNARRSETKNPVGHRAPRATSDPSRSGGSPARGRGGVQSGLTTARPRERPQTPSSPEHSRSRSPVSRSLPVTLTPPPGAAVAMGFREGVLVEDLRLSSPDSGREGVIFLTPEQEDLALLPGENVCLDGVWLPGTLVAPGCGKNRRRKKNGSSSCLGKEGGVFSS